MSAGERADAIPERYHLHDKLATAPCTCDCAQCRAGQCSLKRPLRAAQPEAGSEEGERRLERAVRDVILRNENKRRHAHQYFPEPESPQLEQTAREVIALVRAAHPEADRAPEGEQQWQLWLNAAERDAVLAMRSGGRCTCVKTGDDPVVFRDRFCGVHGTAQADRAPGEVETGE